MWILVPPPGLNLHSLYYKAKFLTIGLPGKSQGFFCLFESLVSQQEQMQRFPINTSALVFMGNLSMNICIWTHICGCPSYQHHSEWCICYSQWTNIAVTPKAHHSLRFSLGMHSVGLVKCKVTCTQYFHNPDFRFTTEERTSEWHLQSHFISQRKSL